VQIDCTVSNGADLEREVRGKERGTHTHSYSPWPSDTVHKKEMESVTATMGPICVGTDVVSDSAGGAGWVVCCRVGGLQGVVTTANLTCCCTIIFLG
jgi:hypothetical protein